MVKLSWEAIRKSLGIPEPEAAERDRETQATRRQPGGAQEAGMDMEVAWELDSGGERPDSPAAPGTAEAYQWGPDDGVSVSPTPITAGQRVTVTYAGPLAQAGASGVVLHYGYGPGPWQNVQEAVMDPVGPHRFQTSIEVGDGGRRQGPARLEFCFRDTAGNWDNNGGRNWSYTIHGGGGPRA
ncbi:MAG: hypothetical protein LOD91_07635 [Limnochordales bacterium]|nr:hypothetical protein [Limnochordales bacterium]